jgi:hypothetical protein
LRSPAPATPRFISPKRYTRKYLAARILSSKTALVVNASTSPPGSRPSMTPTNRPSARRSPSDRKQARNKHRRPVQAPRTDDQLSANCAENGGGPEIRTPKSVTRSWISSPLPCQLRLALRVPKERLLTIQHPTLRIAGPRTGLVSGLVPQRWQTTIAPQQRGDGSVPDARTAAPYLEFFSRQAPAPFLGSTPAITSLLAKVCRFACHE